MPYVKITIGGATNMKTGKLYQFKIAELAPSLQEAFHAEAIKDFVGKEEVQCGGCLHQTDRLFVVAETKLQALRAINRKKMGICGNCIAELIAKEGWNIVSSGDRF
jgi:hypothetical protein